MPSPPSNVVFSSSFFFIRDDAVIAKDFQFHDFLNKMSQFPALLMMIRRKKNWIFLLIFKKFCHSVSMEFFWLVGYNKSCILKVMSFIFKDPYFLTTSSTSKPKWKNDNSQFTSRRQIRKRMINSSDYQLDSWCIISQIFQKKKKIIRHISIIMLRAVCTFKIEKDSIKIVWIELYTYACNICSSTK